MIYCAVCLARGACALYPEDCGMAPEHLENPQDFLTVQIRSRGRDLLIRPANANQQFAYGRCTTQKVLKLGPNLQYFGCLPPIRTSNDVKH